MQPHPALAVPQIALIPTHPPPTLFLSFRVWGLVSVLLLRPAASSSAWASPSPSHGLAAAASVSKDWILSGVILVRDLCAGPSRGGQGHTLRINEAAFLPRRLTLHLGDQK